MPTRVLMSGSKLGVHVPPAMTIPVGPLRLVLSGWTPLASSPKHKQWKTTTTVDYVSMLLMLDEPSHSYSTSNCKTTTIGTTCMDATTQQTDHR